MVVSYLIESYRRYWHRENAKYRAMLKDKQNIEAVISASEQYCDLAPLVAEVIDNVSDKLHFSPVKRPSQLHCRGWLHRYPCGVRALRYRCRYQQGHGLDRNDFRRVLQNELFQTCDFWLMPHLVVDVILTDGVAYLELVSYDTYVYWYYRKHGNRKD